MAHSAKPSAQIRLLLVEDVEQVSRYIRGVLSAQAQVKLLDVITDGSRVIDQIRELQPDVLVVDALLTGKMNGLEVAEEVRQQGFDLPIIALTVPQKPIAVGSGMGIVRVMSMPFSGYDFMSLINHAHAEYRALTPEALSRMYVVYGAKGGVGTSTIAYNLAVAMARPRVHRVALLDGSLQFGDLRALLQAPPETRSILDLPTDRIAQAELSEVVWRDPSGVDVLFGPPRMEMAEMITVRDVEKVLSLLRRLYNVVIVDTPTTVNDHTLAFFDAADQIIQVLTWEAATLHQTAVMIGTFQQIGYPPEKVRYLLNRADVTGGLDERAVHDRIGRAPDFHVVGDDRLVLESNNRGHSFVAQSPAADISRDIMRVARELTQNVPVEAAVSA
ncbi:MAG: response regulator [Chloroflexota bacterium]|nr:response regulator [Chloroflexota bacterium]